MNFLHIVLGKRWNSWNMEQAALLQGEMVFQVCSRLPVRMTAWNFRAGRMSAKTAVKS